MGGNRVAAMPSFLQGQPRQGLACALALHGGRGSLSTWKAEISGWDRRLNPHPGVLSLHQHTYPALLPA